MFDNCIFIGGKQYMFALPHRGEKAETFHDLPGVVIETQQNSQQEHILSMAIDGSLYELLNLDPALYERILGMMCWGRMGQS